MLLSSITCIINFHCINISIYVWIYIYTHIFHSPLPLRVFISYYISHFMIVFMTCCNLTKFLQLKYYSKFKKKSQRTWRRRKKWNMNLIVCMRDFWYHIAEWFMVYANCLKGYMKSDLKVLFWTYAVRNVEYTTKEEMGKCKSSNLFITNWLDMRVTGELIKVHMEKGRRCAT